MISTLRGVLAERRPPFVVLETGGVGYELEMPMSCIFQLPEKIGSEIKVYVHEIIREDAYLLYGFCSVAERSLFRELLKISSVGPRTALVLLSNLTVSQLAAIVEKQDAASLAKLPTIGRKIAERLIVELKDILARWGRDPANAALMTGENGQVPSFSGTAPGSPDPARDLAVAAMQQLGYPARDAERLVNAVYEQGKTTEIMIREALQLTLKGK